jgi:hypothetical protein
MHTPSILSRSLVLIGLFALGACKTTVIGGRGGEGGGDDGSGGTGGVGGSYGEGGAGGGIVAGPPSAIAEYAYMTTPPPPGGSSSGGGASTGVDPNTLNVRIGNYGPTCGGSGTTPFACTPQVTWGISLGLPPDLQAAGTTVSLGDPALNTFFSESGSNGSPDDCWGGGGSYTDGTLEVLSNDGSTIVIRLSGTNAGLGDFSADGQYSAPICQWGLD